MSHKQLKLIRRSTRSVLWKRHVMHDCKLNKLKPGVHRLWPSPLADPKAHQMSQNQFLYWDDSRRWAASRHFCLNTVCVTSLSHTKGQGSFWAMINSLKKKSSQLKPGRQSKGTDQHSPEAKQGAQSPTQAGHGNWQVWLKHYNYEKSTQGPVGSLENGPVYILESWWGNGTRFGGRQREGWGTGRQETYVGMWESGDQSAYWFPQKLSKITFCTNVT